MKCCVCKSETKDIFAPKTKVNHWFCLDCYIKSRYYNKDKIEQYIQETKDKLRREQSAKDLYTYIKNTFGCFLDNRFYQKKHDINNGNFTTKQYPKLGTKINDEELLEMFQQMEKYLKKLTYDIENSGKVHYALAIVYNSYPKYLDWKKKNNAKIKNIQVETEICNDIINKSKCVVKDDKLDYNEFVF